MVKNLTWRQKTNEKCKYCCETHWIPRGVDALEVPPSKTGVNHRDRKFLVTSRSWVLALQWSWGSVKPHGETASRSMKGREDALQSVGEPRPPVAPQKPVLQKIWTWRRSCSQSELFMEILSLDHAFLLHYVGCCGKCPKSKLQSRFLKVIPGGVMGSG